jgi:pSer/pThr/pTyr-binding forkhead associated (FHA) protein
MAYVVVSLKGQEVGRWPLEGPLSIGRSTECDVVIRDILLSRQHCRIEPYRGGWVAVDLGSKNGTLSEDGHRIARRGLRDGEELTLGKTTIRFRTGRLPATHKPPRKRPADPFEALSGTVAGMDVSAVYDPAAVEAFRQKNDMPAPRPMPREPAAYATDDLYSLLTEIASSSWDSIYAQASQPKRPIPTFNGGVRPTTLEGATALASGGTAIASAPSVSNPLLARTRQKRLFADDLQVTEDTSRVKRPATPISDGVPGCRVFGEGATAPDTMSLARLAAAPTADADPDPSVEVPASLVQRLARPVFRVVGWLCGRR